MLEDPGFQIRSKLDELAILSQLGILKPSTVLEERIAPVISRPVCRRFYCLRPCRKPVTGRRAEDEVSMARATIADKSSMTPAQ